MFTMGYFLQSIPKRKFNRCYRSIQKAFLSNWKQKRPRDFFVTTPIFYVNGNPHLGHFYSAVVADAVQRFQKLLQPERNCLFSTGTDEHGLKVQKSAESLGKNTMDFCSTVSSTYKSLFVSSDIEFTHFVRTTDTNHTLAVQHFVSSLHDKGLIYKDLYEGWYCESDETFVTDQQVIKKQLADGSILNISEESGHPVEWSEEVNYIFQLSSFQDKLMRWVEKKSRIVPRRFSEDLKNIISGGLHDLSISRPKSRVAWGVPIPWDQDHTTYVWVDALVNYLTVAGYPTLKVWPPNLQVIGKDILRFHGIYWPALLMAAGLDPPEQLHVHSHWTVNDQKMSKSLGNVMCPKELIETFSVDGLRYLLLRNGVSHSDCSWNNDKVLRDINAELANTLGNLINRLTPMSLNPEQNFPSINSSLLSESSPTCQNLVEQMNSLSNVVERHFSDYNFYRGIESVMDLLRTTNLFIDEQKPWGLKNDPDRTQLDFVIAMGLTAAKLAGIALQPIIPKISGRLLESLGVPNNERSWSYLDNPLIKPETWKLGPKTILFKRITKM